MRPLRALGIFVIVVFIGGALLAPCMYWLVQSLSGAVPDLAQEPFDRFLSTSILIVAIAGLWPLFRAQGMKSLAEIGLPNPLKHRRELARGLAWGLASLGIGAAIVLASGGRDFDTGNAASRIARKLSSAVFTAALVAVLEELLFRAGIFGAFRKVFHWSAALVLSSAIYSAMHFLEGAELHGPVTWLSGLQLLPRMFGDDDGWARMLPQFVNLTLAGALLAWAYQRTGNLWFSIGLHAGWIFWLAAYRLFTSEVPDTAVWWWGGSKLIDGWLTTLTLGLALVLFGRFNRSTGTTGLRSVA